MPEDWLAKRSKQPEVLKLNAKRGSVLKSGTVLARMLTPCAHESLREGRPIGQSLLIMLILAQFSALMSNRPLQIDDLAETNPDSGAVGRYIELPFGLRSQKRRFESCRGYHFSLSPRGA